jgi:hypothetical protein
MGDYRGKGELKKELSAFSSQLSDCRRHRGHLEADRHKLRVEDHGIGTDG